MRNLFFIGAAAAALAATPASATTSLTFNGVSGNFGNDNVAAGPFSDVFDLVNFPAFNVPAGYLISLTVSSSYPFSPTAPGNIDFTSVQFNGHNFTLKDSGQYEFRTYNGIAGGTNVITVNGTSTGLASYTGSITVAPGVPEPASWALMITGFGLVGGAMRRGSTKVSYAI